MKKLILISALLLIACEDYQRKKEKYTLVNPNNYDFLACELDKAQLKRESKSPIPAIKLMDDELIKSMNENMEIRYGTVTFENIINDDHSLVLDNKSRFDSIHKKDMADIGNDYTFSRFPPEHSPWGIKTILLAVNKENHTSTSNITNTDYKHKQICVRDLGSDDKIWTYRASVFNRLRANRCSDFEVNINSYKTYSSTIDRQNLTLIRSFNSVLDFKYFCDSISYEELQLFEDKFNSIHTEIDQYRKSLKEKEEQYREDIISKLSEKNKI